MLRDFCSVTGYDCPAAAIEYFTVILIRGVSVETITTSCNLFLIWRQSRTNMSKTNTKQQLKSEFN